MRSSTLERVCDVDPEDVQTHYTLMLCYRGLGDARKPSARRFYSAGLKPTSPRRLLRR